jgi:chromosome partitioning protein
MPVLAFDRQSKGAIAYLALAGEILRRNETSNKPAATATETH